MNKKFNHTFFIIVSQIENLGANSYKFFISLFNLIILKQRIFNEISLVSKTFSSSGSKKKRKNFFSLSKEIYSLEREKEDIIFFLKEKNNINFNLKDA